MDKFFIENGFLKNIYITDNKILASDENYGDLENFLSKVNDEKKKALDTHIKLEYAQIVKIVLFKEENGIQLFYKTGTKSEKTYLQFDSFLDYGEVLSFILVKNPDLKYSSEKTGSVLSIIKPVLYTIAVTLIAGALIWGGMEVRKEDLFKISGKKEGLVTLLIPVSKFLGFWGSLIVGILVVGGFVFYTIKKYKESVAIRDIYIL